ncbi:MAG: hypothetical protein WBZ35_11180, partial [Pseudolabrys sp.]
LCVVERLADVCLYGLSHDLSLPIRAFCWYPAALIRMSHKLIIGQPIPGWRGDHPRNEFVS